MYNHEKSTLYLFDPITARVHRIPVDKSYAPHLQGASTILFGTTVYFVGSETPKDFAVYSTDVSDLSDKTERHITLRGRLNHGRHNIALVRVHASIYAIGGRETFFHGGHDIGCCERYYPRRDKWTMIPHLKYPRAGIAACAMSGFVYAAGGNKFYFERIPFGKIERLDTMDEEKGWVDLTISPNEEELVRREAGGMCKVGEHELLLFGGVPDCCHVFTMKNAGIVKRVGGKMKPDVVEFTGSQNAQVVKGKLFAIDENKSVLHVYGLRKDKWRMTPIQDCTRILDQDLTS
ncbi:MAG: hypothetical protein P4L51_18380 [Puia sp.]|nr:hypothetical protein [Puia sp.]